MDDCQEKINMPFKNHFSITEAVKHLRSRPVFSNMGIYFFSNIATKIIPFFTLPVITSALPPEEYGMWGIYMALFVLVQPFISFSLIQYFSRTYFKESHHNQASILTSAIFINFIISLAFLTASLLAYKATPFDHNDLLIYLTIPFLGFLTCTKNYLLTLLALEKKALKHSIISFLGILGVQILTVYFIFFKDMSWEAFILSSCLVEGLIVLHAFYIFFKRNLIIFRQIDFPAKQIFVFCLPMVFHSFSAALMGFADRLIIGKMMGTSAVGIYTVGYAVGMIVYAATQAFNNSWDPWILRKLNEQGSGANKLIVKNIYLYSLGLSGFCIATIVAGYLYIDLFISADYDSAKAVVFWTAIACVFQGIYFCLYNIFIYIEKTSVFPISTVTAGIINLALSIILIPVMGLAGAALATTVSFFALLAIVIFFQHRYYPLPWLYFLK